MRQLLSQYLRATNCYTLSVMRNTGLITPLLREGARRRSPTKMQGRFPTYWHKDCKIGLQYHRPCGSFSRHVLQGERALRACWFLTGILSPSRSLGHEIDAGDGVRGSPLSRLDLTMSASLPTRRGE